MSDIEDFFSNISNKECPKLEANTCKTIEDLYSQLESMKCFPDEDIIEKWDCLLKEYIECTDAVFFIRRYASGKKDGKWDTRRGLLTEVKYNDKSVLRYVFVDNFFAQYFFAMAYNKFVPELEEFRNFIRDKNMPYGYLETSEEKPYQTYHKGNSYPLGKNGWKLSHVYSANENDYNFNYEAEKNTLFPKGEYSDWNNKKIRTLEQKLSDDEKRKVKAHFLRVVHPINYFLTPKCDLQTSKMGIKDIGEYPPMIEYRKNRIMSSDKLKDIFKEYQELIMANDCDPDLGHRDIELSYYVEKKSSKATSKNSSKTTNTKTQNSPAKSNTQSRSKKIIYDPSLTTKLPRDREDYLLNGVSDSYKSKAGLQKISEINAIVYNQTNKESLFHLTIAEDIINVWKDVKEQAWNNNGIPQAIVSNYCVAITGKKPKE